MATYVLNNLDEMPETINAGDEIFYKKWAVGLEAGTELSINARKMLASQLKRIFWRNEFLEKEGEANGNDAEEKP